MFELQINVGAESDSDPDTDYDSDTENDSSDNEVSFENVSDDSNGEGLQPSTSDEDEESKIQELLAGSKKFDLPCMTPSGPINRRKQSLVARKLYH